MDEKTAYAVLHPNNWQRRDFKIVGVCEARMWSPESVKSSSVSTESLCGEEYIRIYEEGDKQASLLAPELKKLQDMRDRYMTALEKLMFSDFLPESDERVVRANGLIDGINAQIDDKLKEISQIKGDLHKRALEAQLDACRGNIEYPDKFASMVQTPNATKENIEKMKKMMTL